MIANEIRKIAADIKAEKYPSIAWIQKELNKKLVSARDRITYKILGAYIIGSEAQGTARIDSDIDIAIIIPRTSFKEALKLTEDYYARIMDDSKRAFWNGRIVDFQFFYSDDPELAKYAKIKIT